MVRSQLPTAEESVSVFRPRARGPRVPSGGAQGTARQSYYERSNARTRQTKHTTRRERLFCGCDARRKMPVRHPLDSNPPSPTFDWTTT